MKKMILAVLLVGILAAPNLAMAQGSGESHGKAMGYSSHSGDPGMAHHGRHHTRWDALNLTPEQIEKMKALRKNYSEQTLPLQSELMSKKYELKALWVQMNPDEGKILSKQQEINVLKAQLQEKKIKNRLEMRKILTPEQQARMANLFNRHKGRHGYGRGDEFGSCRCQHQHGQQRHHRES